MSQSTQVRLWSLLAVLTVGSTVLSLGLSERAALGTATCPGPSCGDPCVDNADCNCDANEETEGCTPLSGAGGVCLDNADGMDNDLCVCNPGFDPPNCVGGACCRGDGTCSELGQIACEEGGGTYQGDNVSCTAVNCPVQCGFAMGPECDGECPPGEECVPIDNFGLAGPVELAGQGPTANGASGDCECLPLPPTSTPTDTPTDTPTSTPTDTPTGTPTDTPTDTPTGTPTATNTPTDTPTGTPTNTPTDTPTGTPTNTPTATPTGTATGTPTNTPVMEGGPCEETTDCEGGLVCEAGICTANAAPAPVASRGGLMVIVGLLLMVGSIALVRRRGRT